MNAKVAKKYCRKHSVLYWAAINRVPFSHWEWDDYKTALINSRRRIIIRI